MCFLLKSISRVKSKEDVHENKGLCLLLRSVKAVLSPDALMKRLPNTCLMSLMMNIHELKNSESEEEDKESEEKFRHDDGAAFP
jgi:hypothetical protein